MGKIANTAVYMYAENGNQINEKYYDVNDAPCANRLGIYGLQYPEAVFYNRFDEDCLGPKGEVIENVLGVGITETFNGGTFGFLSEQTRRNRKFKITRTSPLGDGVAIIDYKHDKYGNETERTFFNEDDKPMNSNAGYQKIVAAYSAKNMATDVSYFDSAGSPVLDRLGVHHYGYEKDSVGRTTAIKFFFNTDQPCEDNIDRVYEKKYRYDDEGRVASESYWDYAGAPTNRWNGYHESQTKYNDDGRPVEIAYLDSNGNYTKTNTGYSVQKMDYNARGLVAMRSYYSGDTAVTQYGRGNVSNYHAIKYTYDISRRVTAIYYFDTSNNPAGATFELGPTYTGTRVEFLYTGPRLVQEKIYPLEAGAPAIVIDCLQHRYINPNGVGTVAPNR